MPDLDVGLRARERILLRNLLPKEGDLTSIRVIRDLRNNLEFDEADLERLHVGVPCGLCGEREGRHADDHLYAPQPGRIGWDMGCLHCDGLEKGHDDSEHPFEARDCPVPFTIGAKALSIIQAELQELSTHKKITEEMLDLCDVFYPIASSNGGKPTPIRNLKRR